MLFIVWNNLGAFNRLTSDGFHYFYAKIVRKIKKTILLQSPACSAERSRSSKFDVRDQAVNTLLAIFFIVLEYIFLFQQNVRVRLLCYLTDLTESEKFPNTKVIDRTRPLSANSFEYQLALRLWVFSMQAQLIHNVSLHLAKIKRISQFSWVRGQIHSRTNTSTGQVATVLYNKSSNNIKKAELVLCELMTLYFP